MTAKTVITTLTEKREKINIIITTLTEMKKKANTNLE